MRAASWYSDSCFRSRSLPTPAASIRPTISPASARTRTAPPFQASTGSRPTAPRSRSPIRRSPATSGLSEYGCGSTSRPSRAACYNTTGGALLSGFAWGSSVGLGQLFGHARRRRHRPRDRTVLRLCLGERRRLDGLRLLASAATACVVTDWRPTASTTTTTTGTVTSGTSGGAMSRHLRRGGTTTTGTTGTATTGTTTTGTTTSGTTGPATTGTYDHWDDRNFHHRHEHHWYDRHIDIGDRRRRHDGRSGVWRRCDGRRPRM